MAESKLVTDLATTAVFLDLIERFLQHGTRFVQRIVVPTASSNNHLTPTLVKLLLYFLCFALDSLSHDLIHCRFLRRPLHQCNYSRLFFLLCLKVGTIYSITIISRNSGSLFLQLILKKCYSLRIDCMHSRQ